MQVAGHALWSRAAWLYHGTTFLMTQSFLVSGGLVSKLNNCYKKFIFCLCFSLSKFLVEHEKIREDSDYFAHKVQLFELEVEPAEKG